MKEVIIDGNNLMGKIKSLSAIQKKDRISAREKLSFLLDRYYFNKKVQVYLHFDGFKSISIKAENIKILYSNEKTADEKIKIQIEETKNRKNVTVITSDRNLQQFAKACACEVISSGTFSKSITGGDRRDDEQSRIDEINNIEEFKKIFGTE